MGRKKVTKAAPPSITEDDAFSQGVLYALQHIDAIFNNVTLPDLLPENAPPLSPKASEYLQRFHENALKTREFVYLLSKGDIFQEVPVKGYVACLLKNHIANLRHLTWQVEQVSHGDFSQRLDFMGDFSISFNYMVEQLDSTMHNLKDAQDRMNLLAQDLQSEIELRTAAVKALEQTKNRFQYLAEHDPLTGAMNRRSFLLFTEARLQVAQKKGIPCCIGMLDVDHFKKFNDTYGHINGDEALKHVVQIGTLNLRKKDALGRYGGEEFIFFFENADEKTGMAVAERILAAIRTSPIDLERGSAQLTASFGVYYITPDEVGERNEAFIQKIIARADAALYSAKQEGRDRARLAPSKTLA